MTNTNNPEMPDSCPPTERIVGPAIRKDGMTWWDAIPASHYSVSERMKTLGVETPLLSSESGFVTDTGRYVNRREAWKIAEAAGQIVRVFGGTKELFSECLWADETATPPADPPAEGKGEGLLFAPWTAPQVAALNTYQRLGHVHPFTCGERDCRAELVATKRGWVCPFDDYRQDWAHSWMADTAKHPPVFTPAPPNGRDGGALALLAAYMEWRDSLQSYLPDAEPWMWEAWRACHAGAALQIVALRYRDGEGR